MLFTAEPVCNSSLLGLVTAYIALYALLVFLPILSNGLLLVLDVFSFIFFYPVGSFRNLP